MGTAFLYGNGGSGGTGATLTITAPAGCTVTVSNDGKTKTRTAGADGVAVFKGLATGTWTVTITDGEQTAKKTIAVTADYETAIAFFSATIHITYPAGSTCTATDGVTTLTAPNTSGTWECVVSNAGTWTVSLDSGFSEKVEITQNGEEKTINKWYLYNLGDQYKAVTGGWTNRGYTKNGIGCGNVVNSDGKLTFNYTTGSTYSGGGTDKMVDVTGFKTLRVVGYSSHNYGEDFYFGLYRSKSLDTPVASFSVPRNSFEKTVNIEKCAGEYYIAGLVMGYLTKVVLEL